ncbi:unnamed protein product [Calicophoron daubneyi]|uniref:DUF4200 domain-containing protein n=1 Tax=Calicophoron daubneyi TaxID=300641 RepID=A0AAV2T374_CALDB
MTKEGAELDEEEPTRSYAQSSGEWSKSDLTSCTSEIQHKKSLTQPTKKDSQVVKPHKKPKKLLKVPPPCELKEIGDALRDEKQASYERYSKLFEFTNEMSIANDRRGVIKRNRQDFEDRCVNFHQFILDNVSKMRRQQYAYKHNKEQERAGRVELYEINKKIRQTLERRAALQKKLDELEVYQNIIKKTVKLLPKNYIRTNTDAADSLVHRFDILCQMKSTMLQGLYQKQESIQKESRELLDTQLTSTENLLTKCSQLQEYGNQWRKDMELLQHSVEQYERDRERTIEECTRFFTVIRALRNLAEKSANGINSLQRHNLVSQQKVPLLTNFALIVRFLALGSAIRDEITPPMRHRRSTVETSRTETVAYAATAKTRASSQASLDNITNISDVKTHISTR